MTAQELRELADSLEGVVADFVVVDVRKAADRIEALEKVLRDLLPFVAEDYCFYTVEYKRVINAARKVVKE